MKKHLSKVLLAAFAVMLLSMSLLVGCGGGAPASLDGTRWEITKVSMNGVEMDARQYYQQQNAGYVAGVLEFRQGMLYSYLVDQYGEAEPMEATEYAYMNDRLYFNNVEMPVQINGNTMLIDEGGNLLTLQRR